MSVCDQIESAVIAHIDWKARLRNAIKTGKSEYTPEDVSVDNKCEFGIWLHKELDKSVRNSSHYHDVVQLHAAFHKHAALILAQALQGESEKAQKRLEPMSEFTDISSKLISSMRHWKESIKHDCDQQPSLD